MTFLISGYLKFNFWVQIKIFNRKMSKKTFEIFNNYYLKTQEIKTWKIMQSWGALNMFNCDALLSNYKSSTNFSEVSSHSLIHQITINQIVNISKIRELCSATVWTFSPLFIKMTIKINKKLLKNDLWKNATKTIRNLQFLMQGQMITLVRMFLTRCLRC